MGATREFFTRVNPKAKIIQGFRLIPLFWRFLTTWIMAVLIVPTGAMWPAAIEESRQGNRSKDAS